MKRFSLLLLSVLMLSAAVFAQTGAVTGTVTNSDGTAAPRALVTMSGLDGMHHGGHHAFFSAITDSTGGFGFRLVPIGPYTVTAGAMMRGMASAPLEVFANQITNVTLALHMPGDTTHDPGTGAHGHMGHGDTLALVDLEGTAVVRIDSIGHRFVVARYGLDVDGDGTVDYRLSFGPAWYQPTSGAQRPANGDHITVEGGLFTYADPQMVIVYTINGLVWRRPFAGHGGDAGGDHQHDGCNPDSLTRVELQGVAMVRNLPMWHGEMRRFAINTDGDSLPNFILDFGAPDYTPGNGAHRPMNGDSISIVGGQVYCPDAVTPIVIVYEINGLTWREPGDTVGLGPDAPNSVGGPVAIGEPVSYLTAHNYPNPFNPTTTINYSIPTAGNVSVKVFDITGREVADLVRGYQTSGAYAVQWDGRAFASGIYFYRVTVGNLSFTNRMVLMK
jgi:hypothetical protein